ncbi:MAG: divergent polysaccharide deacetylase family protein [Oceanicaulis sp.]
MARFSVLAPQIGAGLAAAIMIVAGFAFAPAATPEPAVAETSGARSVDLGVVEAGVRGQPRETTPAAASEPSEPLLLVVIDDVGLDVDAARRLMDLPVTLAILPYADAAPVIAAEARAAGREVFVHLPMEPVGLEDPGPGAIVTGMTAETLRARLAWAFSRVPGAAGFNNHMGSRMTSDPGAMAALFAAAPEGELVFLDSLTHPRSVAARAAADAGLASLSRDVFLDAEPGQAAAQLDRAIALAASQGQAIAIGHPYPETLQALESLREKAAAQGVVLTTARALADRRRAETRAPTHS